jgi:hypothetical protein
MEATLYTATSLDGFIARENGDLDSVPRDIPVKHLGTRHYPNGLVQSEYAIGA